MGEFLKSITDTGKFIIMLLIYIGYMTWWAATISNEVKTATEVLDTHIVSDNIITLQTVKMGENLHAISEHVNENSKIQKETIKQHANCSEIMKGLLRRIEKIETTDKELQKDFYRNGQQQFRY